MDHIAISTQYKQIDVYISSELYVDRKPLPLKSLLHVYEPSIFMGQTLYVHRQTIFYIWSAWFQ